LQRNPKKELRTEIHKAFSNSQCTDQYMVASYCPVSLYKKHHSFSDVWAEGFCRIIDIKAKLVAKYYYEMKKYYDEYLKIMRPYFEHSEKITKNEIFYPEIS
jgi:hypothetical protein